MSSLQENSTVPLDDVNKRKIPFSRYDSFDKFQYTAIYTLQYFQLAGTLLSEKSLIQVLDQFLYESCIILKKYAVYTIWPTVKTMYAVLLFWFEAFIQFTRISFIFEKKDAPGTIAEPEKTYILRVQKRKEAVAARSLSANDINNVNASFDKKRTKFVGELYTFPPNSRSGSHFSKSWKSIDHESEMGSNNNITTKQHIGMVVIVYGSATLVYIQLMFLAAFLQTTATPPGLVFLVFSLAYIAYIVLKMGFAKKKSKDDVLSTTKVPHSTTTPTEDTVSEFPVRKSNGQLKRSSTRRFLYFHNKTLSKIKLL